MRLRSWMAVLILFACALWIGGAVGAAGTGAPPVEEQAMRDLERNMALGAALSLRAGTPAEFQELEGVATRGMTAAETWVANRPDSPEAQYALGSWLIYGYRVRHVRELVVDPERGETTRMTPRVVQGMSDDVEPGLAVLQRAMVLAPGTGKYALDYAAALFDCDRPYEAMGLLKRAWAGDVNLTASEKLRTGLILSNIYVSQDNLVDAREWVYSALESNPENSAAVEQLRWLDSMQLAAPSEAPSPTESIPEPEAEEDVEAPDEMSTGDAEEVTPVE